MAFTFIIGLFTGSLITATFAVWAAYHEFGLRSITSEPPDPEDYVTPVSLLDRHTDVSRFCEWGGIAGPAAHVSSDE